jgi:hypothetical protein
VGLFVSILFGNFREQERSSSVTTSASLFKALTISVLLAPALLGVRSASAQTESNGDNGDAPPATPSVVAATREADVNIDGRLDETAWQRAIPATSFVQGEPVEGAPAEQPTEVRVLYDEGAIYVGAFMYDPQPDRIATQLVRRDENGAYDYFELSLDSNNDKRTGYRFRVSASNVQRDVFMYDDVREDENWDAIWQSAVHRDSTGWYAELRIPLSQLRYIAQDSVQSWGINFSRRRLVSAEHTYFSLESRVQHGKVSVFGQLEGLHLPQGTRRIEFRPYVLARANTGPSDPSDPFFDGSQANGRVGLDFRYGLGANYTLDATINPDFGQVEVDPAVVNLTQFEVFFPERRPFFVEDGQVFQFRLSGRQNQLFYTRRIGREPRGTVPTFASFQQVPQETTIMTAAKVTGRSAGGLAIGALAAFTEKESGLAYNNNTGNTVRFMVEPPAQYGVFRAQQDLRDGASTVGGIFTIANRNLPSNGKFNFLPANAYSMGLDFEHNFGGASSRDWALWGFFAGSHVRGDSVAMIRIQRNSAHYFQRPDADYLEVDSTATSLTGVNWRLQFERRSAKHWTGGVWLGQISPGFEVNDLGFSQSNERLDAGFRVSYREITPGSLFRSYRINFFTFHNWRHSALDDPLSWNSWQQAHKGGMFRLGGDFTFNNFWGVDINATYDPQVLSDVETRGGPLMIDPSSYEFGLRLNTDRRRPLFLEPEFEYQNRYRDAYAWEVGMGIGFRPVPSIEMFFEPAYGQQVDPAQYVTTSDFVGFIPTYGNRYFFSDLKRHEFSFETRLNISFNTNLTLQLYAQPLISSGDYLTYKQLAKSETFAFDVFEEGTGVEVDGDVTCVDGRTCTYDGTRYIDWDGDGQTDISFGDKPFNIQSLRLNAVLRWEYRPGSTIFFVWQQNRRNSVGTGTFDLSRDLDLLRGIEPENAFILKVNYWLGL